MSLAGELDVTHAQEVRDVLTRSSPAPVVVDLSGLDFIDSSGITAVVAAREEILEEGMGFAIRGARGSVRRVFEICGLTDLLAE